MNVRQEILYSIERVKFLKVAKPRPLKAVFGSNTFNLKTMQDYIKGRTLAYFRQWIDEGRQISSGQADEIAEGMKKWAMSKGAVYYSHWFQPMTGLTAEKHEGFISITPEGVVEKFSGSNLILGEPDASSFPSGGIRTTFEARGYTAWDPSSPAFIMECELGKTLCIPSIFVSYNGEALDKKLPLLRSEEALSKSAVRLLKLFGRKNVKKVISNCGAEQEYFLIDEKYFRMRQDLLLCGRTLVGSPSPKGQQLEDQYFGSIKDRVLNYMIDVTEEAYKLGIPIKTRHNEVAPNQFEVAPIFEESNIAADHNQLLMDIMKKVALRHGLVCLLHEKPFAGVNGSGKHVNWSLIDNNGYNLISPGKTPQDNMQFLAVLVAVLRAINRHPGLLRASIASAANEHRLGANEAPPAIMSVFLGGQLSSILETIEKEKKVEISKKDIINLGIGRLPTFNKDSTDRNRTSPFAFTGNKFEFRAVGASQSISTPIMVLNTIVAESMDYVSSRIEEESEKKNFNDAVFKVIAEFAEETKNIRFEGNNYSAEWKKEAAARNLDDEPSSAAALKAFIREDHVLLFERYKVLSRNELIARYNIWLEMYIKFIDIEVRTLKEMVDSNIVPFGLKYQGMLADNLKSLIQLSGLGVNIDSACLEDQKKHLSDITNLVYYVRRNTQEMSKLLDELESLPEEKKARMYFDRLKPLMEHIRKHSDELESVLPDDMWDLPKYREMLFII